MQYVYMNEQIRKEKPSRPVIVAQDDILGHTQVREANEFELWYKGQKIGRVKYDSAMLAACETHEVKAWVELDDLVQIVDPRDVKKATKK